MKSLRSLSLISVVPLLLAACSDSNKEPATPADAEPEVATIDSSLAETTSDAAVDSAPEAEVDAGPPVPCPTKFTFEAPAGATNVRVAGEWNAFDLATATPLNPGGAMVPLLPGLHAYKFIYDLGGSTNWVLDPAQGRRKYVGGVENSAVKVSDCRLPTFTVVRSEPARPMAGSGSYGAGLMFVDGSEGSGADPAGITATLEHDGSKTPIVAPNLTFNASSNVLTLGVNGLADGKYRVVVRGRTKSGRVSAPLRLSFWIEQSVFKWEDALVYLVLTDRHRDGDPTNNAPATSGAEPRGDFLGGDLEGVRKTIAEGTLDKLGIRAIWLTPFQQNPVGAYLAQDGVHKVTGYHGYWPIKAREVDSRLGGNAALAALVKEAHAHGIRILQDYVVNHVHAEHEYVKTHPEWFRDGCVCGTSGCDWTAKALECKFTPYLPDINHTVPAANQQFVDDAVWWADTFDLDGMRVDAVKHVEEVATRNLAAELRETFEPSGLRYFMIGETAMGWNDCGDPCNDENYNTISKYIGPLGLDGQKDFVLHHAVAYRTFAYGDKGMLHADYWAKHSLEKFPAGAIMMPYIGSHDTARFTTLADYRGQSSARDRGIPNNQWDNVAGAPTDGEAYRRTRLAFAWLLGLPGVPLIYSGDEYGQWGGVDPNNRRMWRRESELTADEAATLAFVRKLGTARKNIAALRYGSYVTLGATTEDVLVYGRKSTTYGSAIVALSRATTPQTVTFNVATSLGLAAGTVLRDALGGSDVTVSSAGTVTMTVPAGSAAVLSP